jgi:hypothetical protein
MKRSSRSRKTATLTESIHQQLTMYAIAASAAGVSVLALAQPSEAKILYTPAHRNIGTKTFIDLNHDGINDFKLTLERTQHCVGGCTTTGIRHGTAFEATYAWLSVFGVAKANQIYGQGKLASALPKGVRVGPKSKFPGGNLMAEVNAASGIPEGSSGAWVGTGKGVQHKFLGLKFKIQGKTHFGWARFNVTVTQQGAMIQATLTGYAYETVANRPIVTGRTQGPDDNTHEAPNASLTVPISEPAALGALAMGAPGLSIWRRKEPIALTQ